MTRPSTRQTYLVALVDGGGTVPPELGVVRRLVERGHEVTVLAEDTMTDEVAATGATFRPWRAAPNRASRGPDEDPYRDWECKTPFQLMDRILEVQVVGPGPGYAADLADAIADRRPDLIICSFFAYGAMAAAEAEGIPFDILFPNPYPLPVPGMPPFGLGLGPARGPLGRIRDRSIVRLVSRLWARGLPGVNDLRRSLGLEPLNAIFDQFDRARRHLVLTSPDFDFPAELPAHVRYVGPVLDDPAWAADAAWTPPEGDEPLVLVALSSTFQNQHDCLQRIAEALGTLPVRGLITTGPALDAGTIIAPANVEVVPAAPHSEVLRHAAAVVTHGGHGTVVRSLAAGVPMAILHHGRDQADNAARVTARGAGIRLKRSASAAKIASGVRRLLEEPELRAGAERLGAAIRRDATTGALLAELEDLPEGVPAAP